MKPFSFLWGCFAKWPVKISIYNLHSHLKPSNFIQAFQDVSGDVSGHNLVMLILIFNSDIDGRSVV